MFKLPFSFRLKDRFIYTAETGPCKMFSLLDYSPKIIRNE